MDRRRRVVFFTGVADGIGAATARRLVTGGSRLIGIDVQRDKLTALADALGDRALLREADVTDPESVAAVVAEGLAHFGQIDTVVACAAVDTIAPVADLNRSEFQRVVDVILAGTFNTLQATLPELRRRRGYALIVTSLGGAAQGPFTAPYNAAKAGVVALANTLRLEERRRGVRVGVIYFGMVDTEHARRSTSHPLMVQALAGLPHGMLRPAPVDGAAAAIELAIRRRSRQAVYPPGGAVVVHLPTLFQRLAERWIRS
jgi:NAD(P)-dependent dehydrogenase (short-subunit alcohol dehydrogenase family)